MRTGSIAYADQKIQEQAERAAQQAAKKAAGGDQPLVLYFYDGLKILVRPLGDLNTAILALKHKKWSESGTIEAICAQEINQPCALCEQAKEDQDLKAKEVWYLPVYMFQAMRTKDKFSKALATPELITYKEDEETKQAQGVRVLELPLYGAEYAMFKYFREYMSDPENGPMTGRNFLLVQDGKGKGNKGYIVDKKDPKPRPDVLAKAPTLELVWKRLLEKLPPQVVGSAQAHAEQVWNETGKTIVTPMGEGSDDDHIF